jgi:uncharacterized protein (TIGR00369 family)
MDQDIHHPTLTRHRTVDWQDSRAVRAHAQGWTGLQIMRGIRDGTLPPPPIARLIGFRCAEAEPGLIVMEAVPSEEMENPAGLIHGGVAATLLDTAMGAAVHTQLAADKFSVTIDLSITFLRKLTIESGIIRATGRVLNLGGRIAYAEGNVRDGGGKLVAHAVGNFSIITL